VNPLRKIFYNITITSLSIAVALVIGTVELLQVFIGILDLHGRWFDLIVGLDFGVLGYAIVGVFLAAWGVSAAVWKFGHIEERYGGSCTLHAHEHSHDGGRSHVHKHFH
jgi:high-affinity nickel-transport protein